MSAHHSTLPSVLPKLANMGLFKPESLPGLVDAGFIDYDDTKLSTNGLTIFQEQSPLELP